LYSPESADGANLRVKYQVFGLFLGKYSALIVLSSKLFFKLFCIASIS
jgi:hypothetical protein